jgi:titin
MRFFVSGLIFAALLNSAVFTAEAFTLEWQDNSTNEQGFRIERSIDGGTWTRIYTNKVNVTSRGVTITDAGKKYCYRVRAYNSKGQSPPSNQKCVTTVLSDN